MVKNMHNFADVCFWTYILIIAVSLYGFCLFFWWKRLAGHASEVYNYVMLMFFAIVLTYSLNAYARFLFITDIDNLNSYEDFISGFFWHLRAIPNLCIISLIVFRMNRRARKAVRDMHNFKNISERRQIKRRITDK
jgi:hypothetical protein